MPLGNKSETSGTGPAFKVVRIGIKQRLAHKKYKKSDAKAIALKMKQIQDKPDKPDKTDKPLREPRFRTYKPYCPNREAHEHQYRGVEFMIHGGKTTHTVIRHVGQCKLKPDKPDKPDKTDKTDKPLRQPRFRTYKPYCPKLTVPLVIHDGGKTTHTVMSVNDPIYKELRSMC